MVEIIKRGTPYEERIFKVQCRACNSDLTFMGKEVQEVPGGGLSFIPCPVCRRRIFLSGKEEDA